MFFNLNNPSLQLAVILITSNLLYSLLGDILYSSFILWFPYLILIAYLLIPKIFTRTLKQNTIATLIALSINTIVEIIFYNTHITNQDHFYFFVTFFFNVQLLTVIIVELLGQVLIRKKVAYNKASIPSFKLAFIILVGNMLLPNFGKFIFGDYTIFLAGLLVPIVYLIIPKCFSTKSRLNITAVFSAIALTLLLEVILFRLQPGDGMRFLFMTTVFLPLQLIETIVIESATSIIKMLKNKL